MGATEQVKTLTNRILELEQENKRLNKSVDDLTCKLYSKCPEKTSSLSLGQMSLFNEAET